MTKFLPPSQPHDLIVFDCDGTLSELEGIVYLAGLKNQQQAVETITEQAMLGGIMNLDVFEQRLELVKPTLNEMAQLANAYYEKRTYLIQELCSILQQLNKTLWVASAGMQPSVSQFAEKLDISEQNAHAITLQYDQQGQYLAIDPNHPFLTIDGKGTLLKIARKTFNNIAMIGDGANDFSVAKFTDRFIGFGGHYPRESFMQYCQHYVLDNNASIFLPLLITSQEAAQLDTTGKEFYEQGIDLINTRSKLQFQKHWSPFPEDQTE